jgi:hypothetical protein
MDHYYGGINPDYTPVIKVLSNDPDFLPELRFPALPSSYIPQLPLVNPRIADHLKAEGALRDIDFHIGAMPEETGFLLPMNLDRMALEIMRGNQIYIQPKFDHDLIYGSGEVVVGEYDFPVSTLPESVLRQFQAFLRRNREVFAQWLYEFVSGGEFPDDE